MTILNVHFTSYVRHAAGLFNPVALDLPFEWNNFKANDFFCSTAPMSF
ncbi:MAG: hypothetical protein RBR63_02495 [Methanosarcina vacuolata]|nr:hypothetical protein [Methanosarcina vacuolata]